MDNGKREAEFPQDPSKFLLSISVFMAFKKSANVPPHLQILCCYWTFSTMSSNNRGVLTACQISPSGNIY